MRLSAFCAAALAASALVPACSGSGGTNAPPDLPDVAPEVAEDVAEDATDISAETATPEPGEPDAPPPEDAAEAADEAEVAPDPGQPDPGQPDPGKPEPGKPDAGPGPVATPDPPVPIPIEKWLVTYVAKPEEDPVGDALDAGTFAAPEAEGKDALGVKWTSRATGEGGSLGFTGFGLMYAVARLPPGTGPGLIVRADQVGRVWVDGDTLMGDPYGSGRHRLPFRVAEGAGGGVVVVQAWGGTKPSVGIEATGAELHFNLADVTAPDLVVGDASGQCMGVAVLNLSGYPAEDVVAAVVGDAAWQATERHVPALGPGAVTQVAFRLLPAAAPAEAGAKVPVRLRVSSPSLSWSWEAVVELPVVTGEGPTRRAFCSAIDGSAQYYGYLRPSPYEAGKEYGLVLTLHGAGVDAIGQAGAYSAKDFAYVVAPTNRRPFGFDWEEWGRLDALEAYDHAAALFHADPTRRYVTGHSMGGHGTWQMGVLFPGRFAVAGPSAGWSSFYSYGGGATKPTGPVGRARASSDTLAYVSNLARRAVFVIHGDADDNVPISEAYLMRDAVEPICPDFEMYVHPGGGHWWDGDAAPGADCVDWPDLFQRMRDRALDPSETDFAFVTPSPWVNATHSFATVRSQATPMQDSTVKSARAGDVVTVATTNVRGLVLDGDALAAKGVASVVVDGTAYAVAGGPIAVGPQDGKRPQVQGPFNQVFHRPFCLVYPDDGPPMLRRYAAYLVSAWNVIGNGHACALPLSRAAVVPMNGYGRVYVGVPRDAVPLPEGLGIDWDSAEFRVGGSAIPGAAFVAVFPAPDGEALWGVMGAAAGAEPLLFRHMPFSSRAGLPDYLAWTSTGGKAAGFFDATWEHDPAFGYAP
ncbi:MAG: prolyl oligopeptidase family serine peptidase [Deltaproteobacteria bacterium]|nr:prolyl oligopeptidase family serine peptidase [Deltaproteobacteria bacterium]